MACHPPCPLPTRSGSYRAYGLGMSWLGPGPRTLVPSASQETETRAPREARCLMGVGRPGPTPTPYLPQDLAGDPEVFAVLSSWAQLPPLPGSLPRRAGRALGAAWASYP